METWTSGTDICRFKGADRRNASGTDRFPRLQQRLRSTVTDRGRLQVLRRRSDWTIDTRGSEVIGAVKDPDGDLHFNMGITAVTEELDGYSVIVVVAYDD